MNINSFQSCLSRYGATLENWPDDIRSEAEAALEGSLELRQMLAKERKFEGRLNDIAPPEPDKGFIDGIIAKSHTVEQDLSPVQSNRLPRLTGWRMAASIVLFVAGLTMGNELRVLTGPAAPASTTGDAAYSVMDEGGSGPWDV